MEAQFGITCYPRGLQAELTKCLPKAYLSLIRWLRPGDELNDGLRCHVVIHGPCDVSAIPDDSQGCFTIAIEDLLISIGRALKQRAQVRNITEYRDLFNLH